MNKRICKKVMKAMLIVTVVDNIDHGKGLGVVIFSAYKDPQVLKAMKRFPEHEEVIRWKANPHYKDK